MSRTLPSSGLSRPRCRVRGVSVLAAALASLPQPVGAQLLRGAATPAEVLPRPGDTVLAKPGRSYHAGLLRRWFVGRGHRDLWSEPVPAEVLDLEGFAGGLTPIEIGGGGQTRSLRFEGADGRIYNFRSIDKEASRSLDPVLQQSLAAAVLQDRVSAILPLGAMIVAPLLEAAGVLFAQPKLFVMPDHEQLGEFRQDFRHLLGWVEERPNEGPEGELGFADSEQVVGSPRLFDLLEESSANRVDARSFLRARLMDALVGDWDRHPDQWRWARFDEGKRRIFQPIPRDRDWALSRLDGMLNWFTRGLWPHYVGFGVRYPSAFRMTWSGRALDREILTSLQWPAWQSEVDELQERLTDVVIEDAVGRLPQSYRTLVGSQLAASLVARRDSLPTFAREFYQLLANWVDVQGTDEEDLLRVRWLQDGGVRVELSAAEEAEEGEPYFHRTFEEDETREVRVYLRGDDDVAVVEGADASSILLRVVGGGGRDQLRDESGSSSVYLYDGGNGTEFVPGRRTHVDGRDWEEPSDASSTTHQARPRDWGHRWMAGPVGGYESDVGVFFGGQIRRTGFGFRRFPHRDQLAATLTLGAVTGRPNGEITAQLPLGATSFRGELSVAYEVQNSPVSTAWGMRPPRISHARSTKRGALSSRPGPLLATDPGRGSNSPSGRP